MVSNLTANEHTFVLPKYCLMAVMGYAIDQLSLGCYMPITASKQGYILYL